jgi:hypothetical protein
MILPPLRARPTRVLVVGADALFFSERDQIAAATSHHTISAIYEYVNSQRFRDRSAIAEAIRCRRVKTPCV